MANPKHRHSKQRKRKRRTHYKIEAPNVGTCSNCGAPKLLHHICDACGFYRGRLIISQKVKEAPVLAANDEDESAS